VPGTYWGPDGDQIVETFYTISQMDEPSYSEADFEYLPNGGWGQEGPTPRVFHRPLDGAFGSAHSYHRHYDDLRDRP